MHIAIVNVVGVEGSTGKMVSKLAGFFNEKGHTCKVFHGRGERIDDGVFVKHGCRLDTIIHYAISRLTGKEGYYSSLFTKRIIEEIKKFKPQWIYVMNLHGHWLNVPLFLAEISKMQVHILWAMADEYPFTARCEYTNGCEKYRDKCQNCERYNNVPKQYHIKEDYYKKLLPKTIFSSAEYIVNKARESSLLKDACFNIGNPLIDVGFFHPVDTSRKKKELGISDDKIILLDVAPFSNKRKGVEFFLAAASIMENNERYVFINVGYDGKKDELPSNFIAIPYVSDQVELRVLYSMADKYICTSTQDALPNACVEAMSCGTPLIAFNVSGMPYIADYPVLNLVEEVSTEKLVEAIKSIDKKDQTLIQKARKQALEKYDFDTNAEKTLDFFQTWSTTVGR